jgi:CRISPR-associated protein Cas1
VEFSPEPLKVAWQQVRQGSRSAGIDGVTVDLFAGNAVEQLQALQQQLERQIYHPQPAKGFYLPKASGEKRLIGIQTVRDRVVARWLLNELYWPLEDHFLDCSYAYRPGRNIQMAVAHLYSSYQFQPAWVIKADIATFFDSLNWSLLLEALERLCLEAGILSLVLSQLQSGLIIHGQYYNWGQGVVQGAILSGALANLYLSEFDRQCLQAGFNFVRYGDDFAIACPDWIAATRALDTIERWLGRIYLHLQPQKTQIIPPDGEFTFLGHQFREGQVFAPPPPAPPPPGRPMLRESGSLFYLPLPRKTPKVSHPPKACAINRSTSAVPTLLEAKSIEHLWSDTMTTLYVTEQGAYLSVKHQQFQVFYQDLLRIKVPVNQVSHIVLFGCCNVSHGAVSLALRRRIPILYLSQKGRYFGRLHTEGVAKVEYLAAQVRCAESPEFTRMQAEAIVRAKLHNSRALLMKLNRRRRTPAVTEAVEEILTLMDRLPSAESMDALRGYEGYGATVYFQALGALFTGTFAFEKRTKRPPTDPINSLLSLGYTLLSQNVHSFVQIMGLHTHFGNLHVPRDNHPALVSDLMEEFRAQMVDSLVCYLVNKKIFVSEDFTPPDERGGVYLHPDALKKFLKHWEEKLHSKVTHPQTGHKVSLRRCLELQIREYIGCLIGEVPVYRPMIWKL